MADPCRNDKANPLAVYRARQAASWTTNAFGWVAPCGTSEDEWAASGRPFPEESISPFSYTVNTRRVSITLNHHLFRILETRASMEGRSVSNLIAYILERSVDVDNQASRQRV